MNRVLMAWWLAIWCVIFAPSLALADSPSGLRGEDQFPLACTDFTGQWRSDSNMRYNIDQRGCSRLRIVMVKGDEGGNKGVFTIVPDNRLRTIPGNRTGGTVRHRWNSPSRGTAIESHSTVTEGDRRVVELVTLAQVNSDLLLQSVYRTITIQGSQELPVQEYEQHVFRRVRPPAGNR